VKGNKENNYNYQTKLQTMDDRVVEELVSGGEVNAGEEMESDGSRYLVEIPMTMLITNSNEAKPYTLYVLKIASPSTNRNWERRYRYSDMLQLHTYLLRKYPDGIKMEFPTKTFVTKKTAGEVIDWRKFLLKKYVRYLLNHATFSEDQKVQQFFF